MKFIASSLDAAKKKARRALGNKAAIVSVRELPSGDVEVSASDKPAPGAPAPAETPPFGSKAREALDEGVFKAAAGSRLNESIEQRFSEDALSRLRGELTRGRGAGTADERDPLARAMAEILHPHGVDEALFAALADAARRARIDDDLYRLEAAFADTFTFAPLHFSPAAPIMLAGPTGAGKTSSAAKLAAASIDNGEAACILTADVGRAGAIDQIRSYGDTLGAEYFFVETPLDVSQVLRSRRPHGAVIIDTPGVNPYDAGDLAAVKSFQEAAGAETVLVLPSSGDAAEHADWVFAFRDFGVKRCILTKFDSSKRVGAGLSAAFAGGLALAHFSQTPFISEGLLKASPEFLARRLLAGRPGRMG